MKLLHFSKIVCGCSVNQCLILYWLRKSFFGKNDFVDGAKIYCIQFMQDRVFHKKFPLSPRFVSYDYDK